MRFITLLIFSLSILYGQNIYELQLLATKSNDTKELKKVLNSAKTVGLGCYKSKEVRQDGVYYFIRCDKTENYKDIKKSMQKAKLAGLNSYIVQTDKNTKTVKKPVKADDKITIFENNDKLFGNNEELIKLLHNENEVTKEELEKRKKLYLKTILDQQSSNGLYLKGSNSRNFTKQRTGYDLRLQWNLFDGGYLESQNDLQEILLQKELDYDHILDKYRSTTLELSIYKMQAIDNFINYHFFKQQEAILSNMYKRAKRQYDSSMITASRLYSYKKSLQKIRHMLFFYEYTEREPYDIKLKSFIENIENGSLVEKERLVKHVFKNSIELKKIYNKISQASIDKSWKDGFKTNLYVENKKYDYLDESDTVAGVQVQIPLDFNTQNRESKDMEIEANKEQIKYIKKLITKKIDDIYRKINYHKSYIKSLKSDITFFQHEVKVLKLKSKYPLPKERKDSVPELEKLYLDISKLYQDIWLERTETLKLLLKLQSVSGIQILSF
jgi:hypothetical protein